MEQYDTYADHALGIDEIKARALDSWDGHLYDTSPTQPAYVDVEPPARYNHNPDEVVIPFPNGQPPRLRLAPPPPTVDEPTRADRMRARLYSRSQLKNIPQQVPLIEGVLDAATIAVLSGRFAAYKTFVSLSWAASIATGQPWLGRTVTTPGTVLYVAGEGCNGIEGRLQAWEEAHLGGKEIPDDRLYVYDGRLNLADTELSGDVDFLTGLVREHRPVLLVIDTLHKCAPGMDENSSRDMSVIYDTAAQLRETFGTTILFNHHTGHSGLHSRGSSSIEDDADTVWIATRGDETGPEVQRTLTHRKVKNGPTTPDIPIILEHAAGNVYLAEGHVGLLPNGLTAETVMSWLDELGVPATAGRDVCRKALADAERKVDTNVLATAVRRRKLFAQHDHQTIEDPQ